MRGKIPTKKLGGQKAKIKIRYLAPIVGLALGICVPQRITSAASCPELRVVFARGSGGEPYTDQNFVSFKDTIETKLKTTDLSYEFIDLDYPAVSIGIDNLSTTAGAFFGAGDAYEFGASVDTGVRMLHRMINGAKCPNTKYIIGGYSQGAMVVSKSIGSLNADRLIYAATFGDPKIYLPEGQGIMPAACMGGKLSDYRMYVPDCQAYKGMLGAYIPYEPDAFIGKVGTWCNKRDIFCSSHLSISDHVAYVSDNLYEDASRVIFNKITEKFGKENKVTSPHDTAILIDSTGSMSSMISAYKEEALRLARETLESGGRVALYDYRDLGDPYTPVQHCDFNTCTMEIIESELDNLAVNNGGDTPESLLSGSFKVMTDLEWHYGSTKSLVVLTDANFLSPDRDGMTFDEVVAMSKSIDPVNFYIITNPIYADAYAELAAATDGKVVTDFNELNLLTDYIMERYDSLPRVEETPVAELPTITVNNVRQDGKGEKIIDFTLGNGGIKVLVALNDAVLGITDVPDGTGTVYLSGLNKDAENVLTLVPLGDDVRSEGAEIDLTVNSISHGKGSADKTATTSGSGVVINLPKAPNTGKR